MEFKNLGDIVQTIQDNKQKTIIIKKHILTTNELLDIETAFTDNTCVTQLVFADCDLQPEDGAILGRIVGRHPAIQVVALECNCLGDQGIEDFCKSAIRSKTLYRLSFNENDLTDNGVKSLRMLLMYGFLQVLSLDDNPKLGSKGIHKLFAGLEWSHPLTKLHLDRCSITAEGAVVLAAYLRSNPYLKHLILPNNPIGDAGITAISKCLQHVEFLGVCSCRIGNLGAIMLGKAVEAPRKTHLYELDLGENQITHLGLALNDKEGLAVSLAKNTILAALHLDENKIGDKGAAAMAKLIGVTTSLEILDLSENYITDNGSSVLAAALAGNASVTDFYLSGNQVRVATEAFANMLSQNVTLVCLDLADTGMDDYDAISFALALPNNHTLETLNLDINPLSDEILRQINGYLSNKQSLDNSAQENLDTEEEDDQDSSPSDLNKQYSVEVQDGLVIKARME